MSLLGMGISMSVFSGYRLQMQVSYSQCFSRASLSDAHHVPATESQRKTLSLDSSGLFKVLLQQHFHHIFLNIHRKVSVFSSLDEEKKPSTTLTEERKNRGVNVFRFPFSIQIFVCTKYLCLNKLTRELSLMEVGNRLWTARASDSDLFSLAIFFNIILLNIQR